MLQQYPVIARRLNEAGARAGIAFNDNRRIVPTLRAHSLMEWCNSAHPDRADALMTELFKAYFERAEDVSRPETLLQCAQAAAIQDARLGSVESLRTLLQDEPLAAAVLAKDGAAKSGLRVSGVPFFVIENQRSGRAATKFSGAQVRV